VQSDLVNSRTIKDLWNEIQVLPSTYPVFKYRKISNTIRTLVQYAPQTCLIVPVYIYSLLSVP